MWFINHLIRSHHFLLFFFSLSADPDHQDVWTRYQSTIATCRASASGSASHTSSVTFRPPVTP